LTSIDIRAVALHLIEEDLASRDKAEQAITGFAESTDTFTKTRSYKVLSRRVVLPPVSRRELERSLHVVVELAETASINYVGVPLTDWDPVTVAEALQEYPKLFLSVEYAPGQDQKIVGVLRQISGKSYLLATHFAVSFGPRLQTPYFPATQSVKRGVTMSLLYVEEFRREAPSDQLVAELLELQKQAEESFNNFTGIDLSLSPWMDRSVASLIEEVSGVTFTLPGTVAAIRELNARLETLTSHVRATGFNEVMLPLAEDNRLKELARTGQLRFSHLLNYTTYCVAGLDMVVIPETSEDAVLLGTLRDLWSVHQLKRKSIGLRLILAPADEGEEIDLGMFGKTPVISPLL